MDAQQQLVFEGDVVAAVLGRAGEFVLLTFVGGELPQDLVEDGIRRGFHYCGVLAYKNGSPSAQCESDMDSILTMIPAGLAFAHHVGVRLKEKQRQTEEFCRFATDIYRLDDPRGVN